MFHRDSPICIIQLDESKDTSAVKLLPDEMFVALECCLDDEHEQVRRAAAVALYTLERPVEKVRDQSGVTAFMVYCQEISLSNFHVT